MNDIFLDIETIPNQSPEYRKSVRENLTAPANYKKPESIEKWLAENGESAADETIAKTALNPAYGHICCIGFAIGDGEVQLPYAETVEQERAVIQSFFDNLPTMGQNRFIGHNVAGFDLRFILNRAIVLGVTLPAGVGFPRDIKPWSDEVFDTMTAWAGPRDYIKQSALAEALGIEVAGDDIGGADVGKAWANGDHLKIAYHCKCDVETVRKIYRKFEAVGY